MDLDRGFDGDVWILVRCAGELRSNYNWSGRRKGTDRGTGGLCSLQAETLYTFMLYVCV